MKALSTLIVALVLILPRSSHSDDRGPIVSVKGRAERKVQPDTAYVTLYAQGDGILMVDAVKKADTLVGDITRAIKSDESIVRDISVRDIALAEKREERWRSDQKEEPPRPQVIRSIRITCKPDPTKISELIDRGIRAGALLQIPSNVRFSEDIRSVAIYGLENSAELIAQLTKEALANAKSEAESAAHLVGKTVGQVTKLELECAGSSPWDMPLRVMGASAEFPTQYVGPHSRELTLSQKVSVTYELKD